MRFILKTFRIIIYNKENNAKEVSDIFTNITKVNYLMQIAVYLKQRINQLELNADALSPAETRLLIKMKDNLKECLDYEERLHHAAKQQIAFDLDDGVRVNYAKFVMCWQQ